METAQLLSELAAHPDRIEDLPREELPDVLSQLEGLRARLQLRLSERPERSSNGRGKPSPADRPLDAKAVADRMMDTTPCSEWPKLARTLNQSATIVGLYAVEHLDSEAT